MGLIEGGVSVGRALHGSILRTANTLPNVDSKLAGMDVWGR